MVMATVTRTWSRPRRASPSTRGSITVRHQLVLREVKTETSEAPLPLPELCVTALRIRKRRKDNDRAKAGDGWVDNGLVFTNRHGAPIEPRNFNRSFDRCIIAARVAMRILRHSKIKKGQSRDRNWPLTCGGAKGI